MPASASIVVAAIAMPNRPAIRYETMMPTQITMTGSAVASIETARPWITLVPCAGGRALRDAAHRPVLGRGVVLGDPDDEAGHAKPDDRAQPARRSPVTEPPVVIGSVS